MFFSYPIMFVCVLCKEIHRILIYVNFTCSKKRLLQFNSANLKSFNSLFSSTNAERHGKFSVLMLLQNWISIRISFFFRFSIYNLEWIRSFILFIQFLIPNVRLAVAIENDLVRVYWPKIRCEKINKTFEYFKNCTT